MPSLLTIISNRSISASDRALAKFAELLGVETQCIIVTAEDEAPVCLVGTPRRVLAFRSTVLRAFATTDWFRRWLEYAAFVLVYDFPPFTEDAAALKTLTSGALSSVTILKPGPKNFTVHTRVHLADFPVSGKQYTAECESQPVFRGTPSSEIETYISADGYATFAGVNRGKTTVFLLADGSIVDIDAVLRSPSALRPSYASLIALAIFLRTAFGSGCWTSPVIGATLIIDDPFLKRRYGFVAYEPLIAQVQMAGAALTIGFIPFNYRRSDPRTIRLWRRDADRLSLAVHGCDHINEEFASLDAAWLSGSTACALERMAAHQRRTGIAFDRVMIFPHERFSTTAIAALRTHGFTAAVCESLRPVDAQLDSLTVRDLLLPAVTRYEDFPIFLRRLARDSFDFAFDALFQKPILALEHHTLFRNGYRELSEFVRSVSALTPAVEWMPLERAIASTCMLKAGRANQYTVRHYAPLLRLKNPFPEQVQLSVETPTNGESVEAVIVGDRRAAFAIDSGWLRYTLTLAAGKEVEAKVVHRHGPRVVRMLSSRYRIATAVRRMLCDVRDNYLARSEHLLSFAERVKALALARHTLRRIGSPAPLWKRTTPNAGPHFLASDDQKCETFRSTYRAADDV